MKVVECGCGDCKEKIYNPSVDNQWCEKCRKKNPQAYFYRKGGHTAD